MKINSTVLETQPFLRGMAPHHLELLTADCFPAEFRAGEKIFNEDAAANRFYLIQEGEVEVEQTLPHGEARHIEKLGPGDLLGWCWLFPPYCWHYNARAETLTKALCFYAPRVRELCDTNHDLGYDLMKRIAETAIKRLHATHPEPRSGVS